MRAGEFDESTFFRAIHESGARALLIGRRALVLLGLPVLRQWEAPEDAGFIMNAGGVGDRFAHQITLQ